MPGYILVTAGLGFVSLMRQYPGLPLVDYGIRTFLLFSLYGVGEPDNFARSLNPGLHAARWLAAVAVVVAGTAAVHHLLGEHWTAARLRFTRRHVIVCGLGAKGRRLAARLHEKGRRVAAIESGTEDEAGVAGSRALVLHGDATEAGPLLRANLRTASHLVAFSGSDRTNIAIALLAADLARLHRRRKAPLRCAVHLTSSRHRELLQRSALFPRDRHAEVRFFNVEELTARLLLTRHLPARGSARDAAPGVRPHLVLVGFGPLGESVAVQYALLAHHPHAGRPRVTVVSAAPERDERRFLRRYPHFPQACGLEFVEGSAEAGNLGALPVFASPGDDPWRDIVVAGEDDVASLLTALELLEAYPALDAPVHLRMRDAAGLRDVAGRAAVVGGRGTLAPFGQLEEVCSPEIVLEGRLDLLARVLHRHYRKLATAPGVAPSPSGSLRPWRELDEDLREANRRQADHHRIKLRDIGAHVATRAKGEEPDFEFTPDELAGLAQAEHARWCAERHLAGWTHGSVRDPQSRTHPLLVPWAALDEANRAKNRESVRLLPALLHAAGRKIERLAGTLPAPAPGVLLPR